MQERLAGKSILVTGAGSGIGKAVATRFAHEGAAVVFSDRDGAAAHRAAASCRDAIGVELDVSDEGSVERAYAEIAGRGIALDVVVANAGVQLFGHDAPVADLDLDVWKRTLDVNLTGTFLTVKHAVRALRGRGGSIILTGSPTGLTGEGAEFTAYSTTKAGIHGLTRTVAAAYAREGIRANAVVPGYTETPLVTSISDDPESRAAIVSRIPLGRPGTPADVEGIMVFLASDEAAFATGSLFRVDGGMTTL
ncbi:SDR family NAD(P)-dependent oxidoreductase [Paramicrobacterium agarici]|uniref:NAD(P)-dependent dehydrogenase (Short-subunit alcohol dehydrogenase family) n=1 Tax=Paramicrobacterium agarici TaxID=630514 RepID=A0A2A9E193_9MICO|nr:SDR family NAD(P)-dependent oxidoreductase [Microbacterium agarici]PFG31982.1 NAD(P)-dependent dehydrogenase (short-subunit alcohol dehydrogenase family) [Microbacterium agarici]TQO21873.1 NAD(P)-dependent dehydrogenase (short-subunit alcohol dehydrogenase family) [Microbacterium agarici]